ncbi:YopX family protein [Peribacillus frigoritolerans]|uniref:YopX family protein n=1 Tax=Peribacillus frigoritolerans TaxID=450367 RepID=UPI002079C009|nr:YopX family protein [Peribacillus frigoritolerans]USK66280.1 YopX family protein [Peribacillus frigoritolerans]
MREIKFRVWDGVLMHNVAELHFCMGPKLDGKGLKFYGPGVGKGWIDGEQIHLMQYTGLKDKNGVEIYEGDILDFSGDKKGVLICEVVYSAPSFSRKWLNKRTSDIRNREIEPLAWNTDIVYEVIGNIHENPELLES